MMWIPRLLTLSLALLLAAPLPALHAQEVDVSGNWEVTFTGPQGESQTVQFAFTQEEGKVTGKATTELGELAIENGTIEESMLTFSMTFTAPGGGQTFRIAFSATVTGEEMEGSVTAPQGEQVPFKGKRKEGGLR